MCCCENSPGFFPCGAVFLVCSILLIIATIETSRFGPHNNKLALRLTSLTFTNFSISAAGATPETLTANWTAGFVVNSNKTGLTIRISPFYAFLTFQEQVLTSGNMEDHLYLGKGGGAGGSSSSPGQGLAFHVPNDPHHYYEKAFMEGKQKGDLAKELETRRVRMNMNMLFDAYYQHKPWAWEVKLRPYCKDVVVGRIGADDDLPWLLENPVDCVVPSRGYI